jgi:hypothetical protein
MPNAFSSGSGSRRVYAKGFRGGSPCRPARERRAWIREQLIAERRLTLDGYRSATGASRAALFRDIRQLEDDVRAKMRPDRSVKSEWILA